MTGLGPFRWVELFTVRVYGEPKGQPRPRAFAVGGKARIHTAGTAEGWKGAVAQAIGPHLPAEPYDEPVRLDVDFYFPRPKTFSKRVRDAYGGRSKDIPAGPVLHLAKPDRDNADKAVLDALDAKAGIGFVRDDSMICWGTVRKFYHRLGGRPGARLRVSLWRLDSDA